MPPNILPQSIQRLIEAFSRLPGIGPKTASRLTYYLLRAPTEESLALSEALKDLKAKTRLCQVCFTITEESPCPICASPERDASLLCVVEEPLDVIAIERTREFSGLYHVLHGVISPMDGIGPEDLKIRELLARVESDVNEVILATNPSLEGENTAMYIQKKLAGLDAGLAHPVKVTRLARGLPVGGDLEYADEITLVRALQGRREVEALR